METPSYSCGECGKTVPLRKGRNKGSYYYNCKKCGFQGKMPTLTPSWKIADALWPKDETPPMEKKE